MKASKFLVSTAAAITVVGTIGVVYAQTGTSTPSGTYTSPQTQGQATKAPADSSLQTQRQSSSTGSMNRDSTSTTRSGTSVNPSNDPGVMSNERVARADRN